MTKTLCEPASASYAGWAYSDAEVTVPGFSSVLFGTSAPIHTTAAFKLSAVFTYFVGVLDRASVSKEFFSQNSGKLSGSKAYQCQKQIHRSLEEVDSLDSGLVVCITSGVQSGNTRSVSSPLVLPELLICLVVAVPVGLHVVQELCGAVLLDQGCDVRIGTSGVTVLRVGTIAIVRPKSVNAP